MKITNDIKAAMRAKDARRKSTLRMVLSAIKLSEVEKGASLKEADVVAVIQKEIKARQEAIADAERAQRPDLVSEAQAEMAVLQAYLPEQLTTVELEDLAQKAIAQVGATSMREMGQVMKVLMPWLKGRATGSAASQTVRKLLS